MVDKKLHRLLLTTALTDRAIGRQCKVSHNTVGRYRDRLAEENLTWEDVGALSEEALDERLNDRKKRRKTFVEPNWEFIQTELTRVGVTMTLLYEEYATGTESGVMSDREFRRRFARYRRSLGLVMRQPLRPGEQLFVDYSGKRPSITSSETGDKTPVELWVGVMGAGRKTFAMATPSQQLPDWIKAHVCALEYLGAVPHLLVPDNLKSAVVSIDRRNGHIINPTYQEFADHYDTMVMPTRARAPRDKGAVENGVLLAQRWILARLRNRTFFSFEELNAAIAELVEAMNNKPMRSRGNKSRQQLFEELDRPAMHALPRQPYQFAEWKIGSVVAQDYHTVWEGNYYSVPCRLVGSKINVRATSSTVDAFHRNHLVASHLRSYGVGEVIVSSEHQPPSHRMYSDNHLEHLTTWAQETGTSILSFMQQHIQLHPPVASLQAFRGLKRLARDFGTDRLNVACAKALRMKASSVNTVRSMLTRGIEGRPLQSEEAANDPGVPHENIRGAGTYGETA